MIFLKYLFKAKWNFLPPKKNKYVLVDGSYNPFLKYINKKDFTILYRRGEEINFFILFQCLINFKFNTIDYCKKFILYVSPNLIFTAFEYHTIFYKLSKSTGIKTVMLQKGKRSPTEEIVYNSKKYFPKNSIKKYFVDYFFVYNKKAKEFYSKKIGGKFFITGSFENNFSKIRHSQQKKEIIFISNFNPTNKERNYNEDLLALNLFKLAEMQKIKFNILPRFRHKPLQLKKEIEFYKKKIGKKVSFILNKKKTSYEILLKYKYTFTSLSTLAAEFLAKGGRAGFLMFKPKNNPFYKSRYGFFEGLKNKGLFWTCDNKFNLRETKRVFNYVTNTNNKIWDKNTRAYIKRVIEFDYNNSNFNKLLKKLG